MLRTARSRNPAGRAPVAPGPSSLPAGGRPTYGRGVALVLSYDAVGALVGELRAAGRRVIAPVRRGGAIVLDEIESLADLPAGWAADQDGGSYRLRRLDRPEIFGHATPAMPWKRWLYPERTLLMRAVRRDGGLEIEPPVPDGPPAALFGIRSCDVAALGILDRVFLDPADPGYAAARAGTLVVAAACGRPEGTCFCVSMGTGPAPTTGYDIALTELCTDGRHEFVAVAGSEAGAALLDRIPSREATAADMAAVDDLVSAAAGRMGRRLDATHPTAAAGHLDHPQWDDVARRCLACANCTMVCPTCFCSTTEDTTDLAGAVAERWRTWDSCFTLDFSYMGGAPVRASTRSRYRQWLLHKLVTWHDQFGTSGCVGCGRCITWCPVGIDLTAEIAALARDPGASP